MELKFTEELKNNWIKALISGDYKKGIGRLRDYDKYCCLGVLAEIHPDLEISEGRCIIKDRPYADSYDAFRELLGGTNTSILYMENDNTGTFEGVIELIKKIPTHD